MKTLGMIFRLAKIGRIRVIAKPNPFCAQAACERAAILYVPAGVWFDTDPAGAGSLWKLNR
jgi:hypothetical protein